MDISRIGPRPMVDVFATAYAQGADPSKKPDKASKRPRISSVGLPDECVVEGVAENPGTNLDIRG